MNDVSLSHATATPPACVRLDATMQSALNVALWQNHVPVLSELSLANVGADKLQDLRIDLASVPAVIRSRSWNVQRIGPGQIHTGFDLDVQLDGTILGALTEATRGVVSLTAICAGEVVGEWSRDIRILAHNEWGGTAGIPDILAAFVQPNDPAVARIARAASDLLRADGKPDGLEGYQGTKARVWEQAQAIWGAVCRLDIRYVVPPPSFVGGGQRIRAPSQIVEDRLATCLDLAVLLAACLEFIGLRPLLVLQQNHAFAGVWLAKGDFGMSTVDDAPGLRTRLKLDDLLLFETTNATHATKPTFRQASAIGAEHVAPEHDEQFEALIDIHRARQRHILPLPSLLTGRASEPETDAVAKPPALELPPALREDMATEAEPPPQTPEDRLARWRRRLLDLSGRNRLLNMPTKGDGLLAVDCPAPARLAAMLGDTNGHGRGAKLKFQPWPDLMQGADPRSAALYQGRLNEDAGAAYAREALDRGELLVGRDDAKLQAALTGIYRKAQTDQQETGSNTLYLTIGCLLWSQNDRETTYRAPLVLVPVVLERPSVRSGFVMRAHDDDMRLNATLLEMLRQQFAIQFPTLSAERQADDEAGFDIDRVIDTFRAKLRDVRGWEVRDDVALTTLSFTKYVMWTDLVGRDGILRKNPTVSRLMNGPIGSRGGGGGHGGGSRHGGAIDDDLAKAELVCPMEADSSQSQAVARAASGESFVLIGPPGTGKSQTIANIVANTLAQGRTVLFVAEKRAALEVVQRRLKQVGLSDFCLDLFSSKAGKVAVLEQLDRAQHVSETLADEGWTQTATDLSALRSELNAYVRELHQPGRNGWTPFRAIGCMLRADDGQIPLVALSWPSADHHDAAGWRRLVETVEEAVAILGRSLEVVQAPALRGIEKSDWSPRWQAQFLEAVQRAIASIGALQSSAVDAARLVGLPRPALSRAGIGALRELAVVLLDPLAAGANWALADDAAATRRAIGDAAAKVARHRTLAAVRDVRWRPEVAALPLEDIRTEWRELSTKWALARTLGQRALRKRLAAEAYSPLPEDCGPELDRLLELRAIERDLVSPPAMLVLGGAWRGLDTDFAQLELADAWAGRLRAAAASCGRDALLLVNLQSRSRQAGAEASLLQQLAAWPDDALAEVGGLAGCDAAMLVDPARPDWLPVLMQYLTGWAGTARMLQDWCAWRDVVRGGTALGLGPILSALETGLLAPAGAVAALEANYARWWADLAIEASPRLRGFVAARHETRIDRFRTLDDSMKQLAAALVRSRIAGRIPGTLARQHDPEYAVLTRELAKRRRHLPLRQLASRMPRALRNLTPCLMMSPLSVAQYLPPDAEPFDLVIFDEASQIATWDAIGAIGRGTQCIVVGDTKQLPPTSFFERRSGDDDAAAEIETHDLDSILDECIGAGMPSVELTWHYRSRHESLIAFSNHTYYGDRLTTFPSPVTRDDAVLFRYVQDGVYARGGGRTNIVEAREVVAEALRELRAETPRTLGIVTFNAEQQSLIQDLLDHARHDDTSLERFFGDDVEEPVLVKNLEGVQGEERDVMLFSLTYGPDLTGRVSLNFGPLNLVGGERRLNVAITRARERLVVFGSIRPEQIDLSRTGAIGVSHLKQFLSFAEHGARAFATNATRSLGDHESPFEAQVAERLRRRGWTVESQIGVSGFRIDLAVVDPEASGAFLAGVECDGATYHRGATARDRDRLRQHVLEGLGWRVLRVWSTDWWTNADRETERLHLRLADALTQARTARGQRDQAARAVATASTSVARATPPATTTKPRSSSAVPDQALFYDDAYRDRLAAIVRECLVNDGPLREDRLAQNVARLHGFKRTGREIRDRVASVAPADSRRTTERVGDFLWPPGCDPATWGRFRRPAPDASLDPADLPMPELVALARSLAMRGRSAELTMVAMRDACGMKSMGQASRDRFLEAVVASQTDGAEG